MAVGLVPEAIVFDPNALAVMTRIEEHAAYAFIEATSEIKRRCPGVVGLTQQSSWNASVRRSCSRFTALRELA